MSTDPLRQSAMETSPTSVVGNTFDQDAGTEDLDKSNPFSHRDPKSSHKKGHSETELTPVQMFYTFSEDESEECACGLLENMTLLQAKLEKKDVEMENLRKHLQDEMESGDVLVRKLKKEIQGSKAQIKGLNAQVQGLKIEARENGNLALRRMVKDLKEENSLLRKNQAQNHDEYQKEFMDEVREDIKELRRGQEYENEQVDKLNRDSATLKQAMKEQSGILAEIAESVAEIAESIAGRN